MITFSHAMTSEEVEQINSLLTRNLELESDVRRLREALSKLLPLVRDYGDTGPSSGGWQSEELCNAIARADEAIADAPKEPQRISKSMVPSDAEKKEKQDAAYFLQVVWPEICAEEKEEEVI